MHSRARYQTVTAGKWNVSVTTGTGIPGAILNVFKPYGHTTRNPLPSGRAWVTQRGDHDGREFPTSDEAFEFAFEHGYLQLYFRYQNNVGPGGHGGNWHFGDKNRMPKWKRFRIEHGIGEEA